MSHQTLVTAATSDQTLAEAVSTDWVALGAAGDCSSVVAPARCRAERNTDETSIERHIFVYICV